MNLTITDISEGMNSSHEGYADLVAESVSFSLGRPLTNEEYTQIYSITERAISDAVQQLENSETEEDKPLTQEQFNDLADYICHWGVFTGPGGIQGHEFQELTVIDEPTDEPEGRKIYVGVRYPLAVYDFDTGFTVLRC
ncbi:hypothetical protein [Candidatus Pantoea floridensis]|uniref:Uncharacterized protein n=1 Tax=Candidatus Pantoea floridensis TaxID=1938870 RepID=A0A286DS16_9GAMM|nr:hypothetical protein [Pantoea floridensis]PIF06879.1 hypothetical protein BX596_5179 [Enterobacteriaceae bacterium JKS000233]SOD61448.1 hypothetical protein SAMN06273570_5139 [Pantoea floridensis]